MNKYGMKVDSVLWFLCLSRRYVRVQRILTVLLPTHLCSRFPSMLYIMVLYPRLLLCQS